MKRGVDVRAILDKSQRLRGMTDGLGPGTEAPPADSTRQVTGGRSRDALGPGRFRTCAQCMSCERR
ncbi:MAG: hypothetical protein F8N15_10525 [Methanobacterium sp.]|nr:hypothetical protein [Methanobacterium sp.]